jgi:hypothetical protein
MTCRVKDDVTGLPGEGHSAKPLIRDWKIAGRAAFFVLSLIRGFRL